LAGNAGGALLAVLTLAGKTRQARLAHPRPTAQGNNKGLSISPK
jgi:hypothetical protein